MKTASGGRKRARADASERARAEVEPKTRATTLAAGRVVLACTYCHERLLRPAGVYCAACLAPHHGACHAEHGRCAAPGCEEARVVTPSAFPAPSPERRALAWLAVAACLFATVVSAASARAAGAPGPACVAAAPAALPATRRCGDPPAVDDWSPTEVGLNLAQQAEDAAGEAEWLGRERGPRAALASYARALDLQRRAQRLAPRDGVARRWIANAVLRARTTALGGPGTNTPEAPPPWELPGIELRLGSTSRFEAVTFERDDLAAQACAREERFRREGPSLGAKPCPGCAVPDR